MTDFIREVEEDIRQEHYRKLWQRYGIALVAAVVLIVAGTVGFVLYRNWHDSRATAQTAALAQAVKAQSEGKADAVAALAGIAAAGGDQAILARLYAAADKVKAGDRPGAAAAYAALAGDTGVADIYRDLASLLAVAERLDSADPAQLQAELLPLTQETNPWRFTARELSALVAARAGDLAKTRALLKQLSEDSGTPPSMRRRAGELAELYAEAK